MSPPGLTRRAALGLVAAGFAGAGCDATAPATTPRDPGSESPRRTTGPPEPDPDTALVDRVRADIDRVLALVVTAGRTRPALGDELGPWRRLHRRHLAALPGESDRPGGAAVRGGASRVRAVVRREELRLQRTLATAAVDSESGPLAALLASMSAAVAQQLAASEGAS